MKHCKNTQGSHDATSSLPKARELILSGGGTGGIGMLGALHYLHEHGHFQQIRHWIGASVGAMISVLLVAGYTPMLVYQILEGLQFEKFVETINGDSVLGFFDTMGISEPSVIMRLYDVMMKKKNYDQNVTLAEFQARTETNFTISGYNVTRGKTVAFNAQSHPRMPLRLAVRISISVPLLFRPIVFENELYIDGAVADHVPIHFAKYKRRSLIVQCYNEHPPVWKNATNVLELSRQMYQQIGRKMENYCIDKVKHKRPDTLIYVTIPQSENSNGVVDYSLNKQGKFKLFNVGYQCCEDHFRTCSKSLKVNR